jgi:hypothetical protein
VNISRDNAKRSTRLKHSGCSSATRSNQGTLERLQDEVYAGVIDTHDDDYDDGYRRVVAATKAAQDMAITANPIAPIAQTQDRRGICHQFANDEKLKWTE